MRTLISTLITQLKQATPEQLAHIITQVSQAPFAADLLEVDESLWGNFWQGDVIAPGYRLPAVELALLRATRLDLAWPEGTTVAEFLADLHQAVLDPQAGIWVWMVAGEPCVVFASINREKPRIGDRRSVTVVWYCATTGQHHAGYRTTIDNLNFEGAVEQRSLKDLETIQTISEQSPPLLGSAQSSHRLEQTGDEWTTSGSQQSVSGGQTLADRLDVEILRRRLTGA